MQLLTLASGAVFVAAASASVSSNAYKVSAVDESKPYVKVINTCPYKVYAWSIQKGMGCPDSEAVEINPGGSYAENYRLPTDAGDAISIKLSGVPTCSAENVTQVEYCHTATGAYKANYVDMSFVDCHDKECPGYREGFSYVAGNQDDGSGNVLYANDADDNCPKAKCSGSQNDSKNCKYAYYESKDDWATRSCNVASNWVVNLCGDSAGGSPPAQDPKPSAVVPSPSKKIEAPSVAPSSESAPESSAAPSAPAYTEAPAPEVTFAAKLAAIEEAKTKYETVVVSTTVIVETYEKAKRHAHQHLHRQFHA